MLGRATLLAVMLATPAFATPPLSADQKGYLTANTIGIFYHELAHAIIDLYDIPIRVKEEDAADTFSVLLVDYGFDDASGESIANDIAFTFSVDGETSRHFFWDQHSSDGKRAENTICMFAGGDIDGRADLAEDWGMSTRKLEACEEERILADEFWAPFLDEMTNENKSKKHVKFSNQKLGKFPAAKVYTAAVQDEVREINIWLRLPKPLSVRVESCGEANAYYDPEEISIVMCTEYAEYLVKQVE